MTFTDIDKAAIKAAFRRASKGTLRGSLVNLERLDEALDAASSEGFVRAAMIVERAKETMRISQGLTDGQLAGASDGAAKILLDAIGDIRGDMVSTAEQLRVKAAIAWQWAKK